ncbi:LacI family DNA-binding transcriptional regulator [Rhizobium sp. XQZ8]|uniref:PfkB family carbohydrate kinase n=1 Tax=Rhizobium populisoli TaxID=2859785 RepID=UPI001CA378D8|nr:PfkB family carbohydrate kinase [Rhizobium populisoli]MBW6424982.1 LacI family DNA-binding transcriptional regulator [Rhizobium populisoli]
MKSRATIKDVARLAQVSIGTVSRVVNGNAAVTEQNRIAVFDAVKRLGYRPNSVARSLVGQTERARNGAALLPDAPRLTTIGYVSTDHSILTEEMPPAGSRVSAKLIHRSVGGPAANVAIAASRLGGDFPVAVDLISSLGDDPESDWALSQLLEFGLNVDAVERVAGGRLSRSVIIVETGGRRTILNEPLSLPAPRIRDYLAEAAEKAGRRCLHLEGFRVGLLDEFHFTGTTRPDLVTIDTTGLPAHWRTPAAFDELCRSCDFIFMSRPAARQIMNLDIEDDELVAALARRIEDTDASVVLTMGAGGSALIQPRSAPVIVPALVLDPVDVTGAGDVFVGVFLAVYLNTGDAVLAARWAAVGASYSIGAVGVNTIEITAKLIAGGLTEIAERA